VRVALRVIAGAAELSAADSVTVPAATLIVPLTFTSGTDVISGIQFDVETDSELVVSVLPGESAQHAGQKLHTATIRPNVVRFLLVNLD
jgi:hypothetical protein